MSHFSLILKDYDASSWWESSSTQEAVSNFLSMYGNGDVSQAINAFRALDKEID